jgi:hypothetical protein
MRTKIIAVIALLVALTFLTIGLIENQSDLINFYYNTMAALP